STALPDLPNPLPFSIISNPPPTYIYTLSLHDALPIYAMRQAHADGWFIVFDSLTVNAGNGGFLHSIQMDTSVNAANQVVDRCIQIGRAVQQECRDRTRMPSSA